MLHLLKCHCYLWFPFLFTTQVGRSVDETLRLVQAFQYTDKHGEGIAIAYFEVNTAVII